MIQCKFQNIKDLKANEAYKASKTAKASSLNKFLLNMLFNQVKNSVDFDS